MSPMSLLGCPASFQGLMEKLMDNISNIIVYIDDLLVHLQSNEQQLMSLELVMQRLEENNMKTNLSNVFWQHEGQLSRIHTTTSGIKQGKEKLKAVETAEIP
jgi:hypothetical protein